MRCTCLTIEKTVNFKATFLNNNVLKLNVDTSTENVQTCIRLTNVTYQEMPPKIFRVDTSLTGAILRKK